MRYWDRASEVNVFTTGVSGMSVIDLAVLDLDFTVSLRSPERRDGRLHVTPRIAFVDVFNLPPDAREKIRAEKKSIEIRTGYDGQLSSIFRGMITNVVSYRNLDEPGFITRIAAATAWDEYKNALYHKAFSSGTPIATIALDIASAFTLPVVNTYARPDTLATGSVFSGRADKLMTKLARDYDLSWAISDMGVEINDALNPPLVDYTRAVVMRDDILSGPTVEESIENKGTRRERVIRRVHAVSMLNPALAPKVPVRFEDSVITRSFSDIATNALRAFNPSAFYICRSVAHRGSTYSDEHVSEIETEEEKLA